MVGTNFVAFFRCSQLLKGKFKRIKNLKL